MKTNTLALTLTLSIGLLAPLAAQLEIKDTKGKHLDILSGDKVLVRYMYEHDISTDEKKHATYKPYLHVFDAAGKVAITKGPGGQYTHHRGIFIGWSKLGFNGKSYDRWHMKDGAIVHQKFHEHKTRGNTAGITSVTQWHDNDKKPILDEERTMTAWIPKEGWSRVVIFFKSKLTATYGDVALKGDPEHAGIQYRPADEVNRKKTRYLFPKEEITAGNVKKHKDLAIIGISLDHEVGMIKKSIQDLGITFPVIGDGRGAENDAALRWFAEGPVVHVIDKSGKVAGLHMHAGTKDGRGDLIDAIERALR